MRIVDRSYDLEKANFSEATSPLLQRIYQTRGISCDADLSLQLSKLPSPKLMHGLDTAVEYLVDVLHTQQKIVIVGDFDADGATSSALMVLALTAMGYQSVEFLVPNRFDYGYGLTPEIVELAQQKKPQLIITVDNGISSIEGVDFANKLGIKVIVTDHHLPGAKLPNAAAIVNPNQPGCEFPCKNLAGVAVAFYLLSALRAKLRELSWFEKNAIQEPNMAHYLDLVALGTVADVVPLDQVNRALVHQGLLRIRAGYARPGINALLKIAGKNPAQLVASDMGFSVAPRLNAAGRLDDISYGIQCLLTDDPQEALDRAQLLEQFNQDRKAIERDMQIEALNIVEGLALDDQDELPAALCLYQADWHQGVVGLLASRIKEKFHRPVAVFARDDSGTLKGSVRSIPGLHIRDALDAVATQNPGLISKFGGHAMAAGLSLEESQLESFEKALQQQVASTIDPLDLEATLQTDGQLETEQLTLHTASVLRDSGPWGQAFPEPCFEGEFELRSQRIVGENHLKISLAVDATNAQSIDGIYFNIDTEQWPTTATRVRCVYRLDINQFRGRESLQLLVQYMQPI
ncbi:single-stranded-DNA-specific exonuclease RecJ [Porticoccaceae bacterium]|jgi:single-stranded-DNA-specific exonuclease|nr:single-stranded-DNA-specific exonuclease RecJ [Porticoccaceae bacterium]MDA9014303.1 single-stranded-DNA-specific exonuclease RecJ [Porticoccaceae bacterium]